MKRNYEMMRRRMEKDMSIKDLSAKTGLCAATVSKIERNYQRSSLENFKKIANALDATVADLFSEK